MIGREMKTNHEHFTNRGKHKQGQRGNALIYVLIAIALFAALSFTLSRQSGTDEASDMDASRANFYATQLISYATQAKSVVDQMTLTGTDIDAIDFILPSDPAFNTAPHIDKIYHPEGGGLSRKTLTAGAVTQNITDPVAGWYLGRFNNVEWTASVSDEVILVAYQISRLVCEQINRTVNGSIAIPTMGDSIRQTMIDASLYTGSNTELTTDAGDICPECDRATSLCVENQGQDAYAFYTILADQ